MKINTTLSVCVMSGKGGVGKTNLTLNTGYCLYKGNHSLLLMDCDLGLANLDVLLGIAPEKNLQDLLDTDIDPKEVAVPLAKGGFDFLPAASGVPELIDMDEELRNNLFKKLSPLFREYDFLFLDLGAGINPTVLSFAIMSHLRIVLVTPEPTSLTDSYALMKVLSTQHNVRDFYIVVNMAETREEEKQTFKRLATACNKFLGLDIHFLGGVMQDKSLVEAVRMQKPLMVHAPKSKAAQDIFNIALKLQRIRKDMLPDIENKPVLDMHHAWEMD